MSTSPSGLLSVALAAAALLTVSLVVGRWGGLGQARAMATAAVRAVVQLAAVALVIRLVFDTPALAPVYLTVMVSAAVATSVGRLRTVPRAVALRAGGTAIVAGATVSTILILASGALPLSPRTAVPMAAQLIGGAMTATTLAGRRMVDDVVDGWADVEGWLALGAAPGQAVAQQARRAAARAGEPNLDQTRNVGLVVLPGSFVGLLLGGASPAQAAATQLLVLLGLMATQTLAAVLVTRLLAGELGRRRPAV
jgi:putative ABC transport system permease protein